MTARLKTVLFAALLAVRLTFPAQAAEFVSPNFVVHAPSEAIARQVAAAAEHSRRQLSIAWYGHEIKNWGTRCDVTVKVGDHLGAGGATRFKFDRGEVFDWRMEVQGSLERILDSVIPHEVNHTILACYFRRKVPRWADEGAATIIEHISERQRQIDLAEQLVNQGRRIPLRVLMDLKQYPSDSDQVMAMYAQSYTLTEYLLQQGGRQQFLNFLNDAHHRGWNAAVAQFYKVRSIEELERNWSGWLLAGMPRLNLPEGQLLALNESSKSDSATLNVASSVAEGLSARGQNPSPVVAPGLSPEVALIATANGGKSATPLVILPVASRSSSGAATVLAASRVRQFELRQPAPDPRHLFVQDQRAGQDQRSQPLDPPQRADANVAAAPRNNVSRPAFVPVPPVDLNASGLQDRATGSNDAINDANEDELLQPLNLIRVSDRRETTAMPDSFPRRVFGARQAESPATAADLRETELRSATPRAASASQTADWRNFPSRLR